MPGNYPCKGICTTFEPRKNLKNGSTSCPLVSSKDDRECSMTLTNASFYSIVLCHLMAFPKQVFRYDVLQFWTFKLHVKN